MVKKYEEKGIKNLQHILLSLSNRAENIQSNKEIANIQMNSKYIDEGGVVGGALGVFSIISINRESARRDYLLFVFSFPENFPSLH